MALLTAQTPHLDNTELTMAACAGGGDSFANNGRQYVLLWNGGASPLTVTFDSPGTCSFGTAANAVHDLAPAVAGNATTPKLCIIGPFSPGQYNDTNGLVQITYSGVTSLRISVITI